MKRLRVAVIGGGHLGRIHSRLLKNNRNARLVAVCDPQPLIQQQAIAELDVRAVSDYQKVIDEIDAAVIATPSASHAAIAFDLLDAGKHLLIEKPVTVCAADAREIAERAAQKEVCVQVGHVERFNSAIHEAIRHVGKPRYIEATRASGFTFRSTDIGVVHDLMIHDIDLAQFLFDSPAMQVYATGVCVLGHNEDIAEARIEFGCGGVANLRASRCSFKNERTLRIFGTQGFAAVDLATHTVSVVQLPAWIQQREVDVLELNATQQAYVRENLFTDILPQTTIKVTPQNAIEAEHQDWLAAISEGRSPTVTADQGARNVELVEKVLEQIADHNWARNDRNMTGPLATPSDVASDRPIPDAIMSPLSQTRKAA